MKCFYHGADMDGKCSGAIVKKMYGDECEYIPYFYDEFPFNTIKQNEWVILVDCSCDFNELLKITNNICWLDHHITAIEKYEYLRLDGIRRDGTAACELCWEYYYPDIKTPKVIKLLGDYDVWKFAYGDDTNKLQTGIRLQDTRVESDMWSIWFGDNGTYDMGNELMKGAVALQYRNDYYRSLVKSLAFFVKFEGYIAVCCNAGCVSSQLFDSIEEEYDIMIPFSYDGKTREWKISLYTKNDDINVGEIATEYGGGGHKKAAGFKCKELPW